MQMNLFMENLYILDDGRVRQFLIVGKQSALLIDTGFEDSNLYGEVKKITDLPVTVIMTHGDTDHTGGLKDFGECYLHEKDWHLVKTDVILHPLHEGDIFECGGYRLETIEIPGHTYGSVAYVDWTKKLLLPGDSVQKGGPIFMFGNHRNLKLYIESQKKLCGLGHLLNKKKIETIFPCHGAYPLDVSYIEKNLEDALALENGRLTGAKHPFMPCRIYRGTSTDFLYE